ncbi:MAG TPA: 23S rRNA (guanosine(2251)-2'-O)-methyltransferase RlmB [Acidimicrobiales bacterium]|nr:23S rRNA (guanosine(2251)-2'-O)-methyltransferase RlmB [Acidimicrobiales bacterium]
MRSAKPARPGQPQRSGKALRGGNAAGAGRVPGSGKPRRTGTSPAKVRPAQPQLPRRAPAVGNRARARPDRAGSAARSEAREGLGGEQVEGRQAVAELLAANRRRVAEVWLDSDIEPAPILDRITELAARRRVPVRYVNRTRLETEARTEAPQGVLAHAEPLAEAQLDDLFRRRATPPFVLALDGVTDPRNLGALLRTADGAGVTGAFMGRHRAVHVTPAVTKAAAGAIEHVPMALVSGIPSALTRATEKGLWVVGLDPEADGSLFDLPVADQPVVMVLGAEGKGLARLVRQRCDTVVRIPLHGALEALNVSAAGAIALFEVSRRRQERPAR